MYAHEADVGARNRAQYRVFVPRRHDVDDLASGGSGKRGRDDTGTEAGSDDGDPHSPITSGASCTGRWNRRKPACVSGPIVSAINTVPMPTLPPRRNPTTSALHSIVVRTTHNR